MTALDSWLSGASRPAALERLDDGRRRLYLGSIAALAVLYVIQALSPMRVDNDSVVLLRAGVRMASGLSADFQSSPLGYPAFIAVLDRLGIASYPVFVLVNCAFVLLAVVCTLHLVRDRLDRPGAIWIVPLTLLAFPVIRYMPMPLPEVMFMGIGLAAVVAMDTALKRQEIPARIGWLVVAVILTTIGITVRMMGFVLVIPLFATCFLALNPASGRGVRTRLTGLQIAFLISTVIVIAVVSVLLVGSFERYASETALKYARLNPLMALRGRVLSTWWSLGSLVTNLPSWKFNRYDTWFIFAGLLGTLVALGAFRFRWPRTPAGIYLASSIAILIVWPYNSIRLWLPVVPLLIAYILTVDLRFTPGVKWRVFTRAYLVGFVVTGLATLAYTTRITFSGKNFPNVYGLNGGMSAPDPTTGRVDSVHNARAKALIERYGRRF